MGSYPSSFTQAIPVANPTGVLSIDTNSLQTARDSASPGDVLRLNRGTYVLRNFPVNKELTLDLSAGAILKLASGSDSPLLSISAPRVKLWKGGIDGNLTGQSAFHYLIDSTADDTEIVLAKFINALAGQVKLGPSTKGGKVLGNLFDGNGGVQAGAVTSSRNAIEIHGSHNLVAFNHIRDISQGHGVRVGRINGTDPEIPDHNLIALNIFSNILDPVNESPAMKAEIKSIYTAFIGNFVKNCTRALKCDNCSHVTFVLNVLTDILSPNGINAAVSPFLIFALNRMRDCGGGLQMGDDATVVLNILENIGASFPATTIGGLRQDTTQSRALVALNVLKNVNRFPILLSSPHGRALFNRLENCIAAASTAQIRTGNVIGDVGCEQNGNTVINPSSVSGTVTAFEGVGAKLKMRGGTLIGAADVGVSVVNADKPLITDNHVSDATTPINIGAGVTEPAIGVNPGSPSSEIQTIAADANLTLTCLLTPQVTIHTATLTANRITTFVNAYKGAKFRVSRSGAGAFTLTVATKALATGQWVDVQFDGATWIVTAFGNL